jgi:hypothetical protein
MITPALPQTPKPAVPALPGVTASQTAPVNSAAPVLVGPPPPQVSPVGPPRGVPTPTAAPASPAPVSAVPPTSASTAPSGSSTSSFGPGNDLLSTQINPNTGGPNRTQIATNQLASWDAENAPQLAAQERTVGQNAAKFGRIGAGMTTNDLTGAQATYDRNRMTFANQLAGDLANGTISDQQNANDQLRQERAYETSRADKAQQDSINQVNNADDLQNSALQRALEEAQFGYGGSPVDTLSGFSGALGQSAAGSTSAGLDLLTGANKQPTPFDFSSLLPKPGQVPAVPATTSPAAQSPYWLGSL